jgi:antitoxin VapB
MSITAAFTDKRCEAVRLPAELLMPAIVKTVQLRARGVDCLISPVCRTGEWFLSDAPWLPMHAARG